MGGVRKGRTGRPMRGDTKKTPVVAIVQRTERSLRKQSMKWTASTLTGLIKKHVAPGSTIYTDELSFLQSCSRLARRRRNSSAVSASQNQAFSGVYVKGDIHTNTVEGLWSLIKNGIRGVYHSVSPEYLQTYLDEYTFRYNRRHDGNKQFRAILRRVVERAS